VNEIFIATLNSAAAELAIVKEGMSQVSLDSAKVVEVKASLEA
jgi:flagellin-like hook-associated protein FlgL